MISLKRKHGLGNMVMLLPVLKYLINAGESIILETNEEWIHVLESILPGIKYTHQHIHNSWDLDEATKILAPNKHRTQEFAEMFSIRDTLGPFLPKIPLEWSSKYENLRNAVVFSTEAGHPSRKWNSENCNKLSNLLLGSPLVLVGLETQKNYPNDFDLRGRQSLSDLIGLLSISKCLISFDSGTLHAAMLVNCPVIAIFTSIDPTMRVMEQQRVIALKPKLHCAPCNKNETCQGRYECTKMIAPDKVVEYYRGIESIHKRTIINI